MAVVSALLMSTFTMAAAQEANPEKLTVEPVTVVAGEETEVTVNYESEVERSGFQVDVILPEGLSFVKAMNEDEEEVVMTLGSSATKNHQASEKISEDNPQKLTLVVFDLKKKALKNGVLFTFKVKADESLAETSEIKFERIKFNGGEYLENFTCPVTKKVVAKDVVVAPEANSDIAAAVAAAIAETSLINSITINLEAGTTYTVNSSIEAPASVVINGNGATIDASALAAPFIVLTDGNVVEGNEYKRIANVKIDGVTVKGLKNSILYDNNVKICVVDLTVNNSVFELLTEEVKNDALISFQAGGAKDVNITNSTFYGNNAVAKFFIRYNNSARLDRYGFDKETEFQTMNYQNNTFYGLLKADGQWGNYSAIAGQNYIKFDVQNNIWYNCGKDIIRRMAGGRFGSNAPQVFANNTYFNDGADMSASEASYDKSGTILITDPTFVNATEGDFTIGASTQQAKEKAGDPRWLVEYVALDKTALESEITTATELLGDASTEEGTPGAALKSAIDEAQTTLAAAVAQEKIDEAVATLKAAEAAYNEATGISNITSGAADSGAWYNMQGVKVEKPAQKGVYIHNGKKIVVK